MPEADNTHDTVPTPPTGTGNQAISAFAKKPSLETLIWVVVSNSFAILLTVFVGLNMNYLTVGTKLGGPDPNQTRLVKESVGGLIKEWSAFKDEIFDPENGVCGRVPFYVDKYAGEIRISVKDLQKLNSHQFLRVFHMISEMREGYCDPARWRDFQRRWQRKIDRASRAAHGLEEEDDDSWTQPKNDDFFRSDEMDVEETPSPKRKKRKKRR